MATNVEVDILSQILEINSEAFTFEALVKGQETDQELQNLLSKSHCLLQLNSIKISPKLAF